MLLERLKKEFDENFELSKRSNSTNNDQFSSSASEQLP